MTIQIVNKLKITNLSYKFVWQCVIKRIFFSFYNYGTSFKSQMRQFCLYLNAAQINVVIDSGYSKSSPENDLNENKALLC